MLNYSSELRKLSEGSGSRSHNLLGKMSVNEIIFELSKMERIVEKSGAEYFAAVPKKVEKIVDLFKDMIPMG